MITNQPITLVEGRWTETLPNPDSSKVMIERATKLKCHEGVASLIRMHAALGSSRPVARALNLIGIKKDIVEAITADIEPLVNEWNITQCNWDTPYTIKGQPTWYNNYRRPPDRKIKCNFPAWKFENSTTGKFFIVAEKAHIPSELSRRIINQKYAIVVTGSYSLEASAEVIRRFYSV